MNAPTLVTLGDVKHTPKVLKELPSPLRNGDHVHLHFMLRRRVGTRTEELHVQGEFRVTAVAFDASRGPLTRQLLTVESIGVTPLWKAVKTVPEAKRRLPPCVSPRTSLR